MWLPVPEQSPGDSDAPATLWPPCRGVPSKPHKGQEVMSAEFLDPRGFSH